MKLKAVKKAAAHHKKPTPPQAKVCECCGGKPCTCAKHCSCKM